MTLANVVDGVEGWNGGQSYAFSGSQKAKRHGRPSARAVIPELSQDLCSLNTQTEPPCSR